MEDILNTFTPIASVVKTPSVLQPPSLAFVGWDKRESGLFIFENVYATQGDISFDNSLY